MTRLDDASVAIAHDFVEVFGGAERVAAELARTFDAPLYCLRADDEVVPADVDVREVTDGLRRRLLGGSHVVRRPAALLSWGQTDALDDYDVVIVTKPFALTLKTPAEQAVVRYIHTPERDLYDLYGTYAGGALKAAKLAAQRAGVEPARREPDAWVANSELVQRRVEVHYGIDRGDPRSTVVYPPVDTTLLDPEAAETGVYYLSLSRLSAEKRVDDAIRAAAAADLPLQVAGAGPMADDLRALAQSLDADVTFHGYVDEQAKAELLAGAKALLMTARAEDFGIVPVEAFASGTPVIGAREGFTKFQVEHGTTGLLYDHDSSEELAMAIARFEAGLVSGDDEHLVRVARRCSADRFRDEMRTVVERAIQRARVGGDWSVPDDGATIPAAAGGVER